MIAEVLKSKIHRAAITQGKPNYIGFISIDKNLTDATNLVGFEKLQVANINNEESFETSIIRGERGCGVISTNCSAARKAYLGDLVVIASVAQMNLAEAKTHKPSTLFPSAQNQKN